MNSVPATLAGLSLDSGGPEAGGRWKKVVVAAIFAWVLISAPTILAQNYTVGTNGPNTTDSTVYFGARRLSKIGSNTVILTGANTYQRGTTINAGTLQIGNGGATGTVGTGDVINNSTLVINRNNGYTLSNAIGGPGLFVQAGTGTTTLSGPNTYSGGTTVNAGTLVIATTWLDGASTLLNNSTNTLTINNGGTVTIARSNFVGIHSVSHTYTNTINMPTVVNAGGLLQNSGAVFNTLGNLTLNGGTLKANDVETVSGQSFALKGTVMVNGSATSTIAGNGIALGAADVTGTTFVVNDGAASTDLLISGVLRDGAGNSWPTTQASSLTKNGSGMMLLAGNNTYTGTTTINDGTLQVGNGGTSGALGGGAVVNNALLALNRSDAVTVANAISGSGAVNQLGSGTTILTGNNSYSGTTTISAGTFQVGNGGTSGALGGGAVVNNASLVFNRSDNYGGNLSNAISGGGSLKVMGGSLNLTADNSYTGLTSVESGKLSVNGSIAGALQIDAGATLGGSGAIAGDATIAGTHSPGNSPGIQNFGGNLTYQPGSTMLWQLADNTTANSPLAYDQVMVGGNLAFNDGTTLVLSFNDVGSVVNWTDSLWASDQSWTIYQVTGSTTGLDNLSLASYSALLDAYGNDFGTTLAGSSFSISQNGQNVTLSYTVPEPSTYVLFGLGGLALVIAYRRKRG